MYIASLIFYLFIYLAFQIIKEMEAQKATEIARAKEEVRQNSKHALKISFFFFLDMELMYHCFYIFN